MPASEVRTSVTTDHPSFRGLCDLMVIEIERLTPDVEARHVHVRHGPEPGSPPLSILRTRFSVIHLNVALKLLFS
jgi:hypothetical protein